MTFQKKATTTIREVEHELADVAARIEQLRGRREHALLFGDGKELDAIETTLAALNKQAGRAQERLRLLQAQAEQEEQAAVQKRREALRERFRKRLAEADQAAVELQETVARAVVLYRKIIDIRETARAAWPISDSHLNAAVGSIEGACLSGSSIRALLSYEFYRASADPFLGGVPGERRQQSLPGAVSPRIDQQLMPSAIKPFADALKQASAFAVDAMSTKLDPLRALKKHGVDRAALEAMFGYSGLSRYEALLAEQERKQIADGSRETVAKESRVIEGSATEVKPARDPGLPGDRW